MVGSSNGYAFKEVAPIPDDEFSDRLSDLLAQYFACAFAPADEDKRLEFDLLEMKLKRLAARHAPTSDKLAKTFERFITFNDIKTERKNRRVFEPFVKHVGDIPISQVTSAMLREYRNKMLSNDLSFASVKAAFTPIKSLFRFALDEEIVDFNPTQSLTFPGGNRLVGETKHLAFEPDKVRKILGTIDDFWLKPFPYLNDESRIAIRQIVRALVFTAA